MHCLKSKRAVSEEDPGLKRKPNSSPRPTRLCETPSPPLSASLTPTSQPRKELTPPSAPSSGQGHLSGFAETHSTVSGRVSERSEGTEFPRCPVVFRSHTSVLGVRVRDVGQPCPDVGAVLAPAYTGSSPRHAAGSGPLCYTTPTFASSSSLEPRPGFLRTAAVSPRPSLWPSHSRGTGDQVPAPRPHLPQMCWVLEPPNLQSI